jgi:Secretion system C-terminal sorting domain
LGNHYFTLTHFKLMTTKKQSKAGLLLSLTIVMVMLLTNANVMAQGHHHGSTPWQHHHDSIPVFQHDSGIVDIDSFSRPPMDSSHWGGGHHHQGFDTIQGIQFNDSAIGNWIHGQHWGNPGDTTHNGGGHDSIPNGGGVDSLGGFGHDSIPSGGPNDSLGGHWNDSIPTGGWNDSIPPAGGDSIPNPGFGYNDSIPGGPVDSMPAGGCNDTTGAHQHRNLTMSNTSATWSTTMALYPNPMSESATINITGTTGEVTFRLYDCTGRLVVVNAGLTNGNYTLTRETLSSGIYVYQILDGSTVTGNGKVVIK